MSIAEVLKEHIPEYYNSLQEKCKTCKYLLSSYECDCCDDNDMYINETSENNKKRKDDLNGNRSYKTIFK